MTIALCLGGAECVWQDADAAFALFKPDAVYACNDIAARWPGPIDFMCSLHAEHIGKWKAERARRGHPGVYRTVAPATIENPKLRQAERPPQIIQRVEPFKFSDSAIFSGSSGLYTAKIAMADGHKVVMAGVPLDGSNNFARGKPWLDVAAYVQGWEAAIPILRARVRSMSGRTADVLGKPTSEWLAETLPKAG